MSTDATAKRDIQKLQRAIVDGLEDVKAQDIEVFNTEKLTSLFERVMIASGTSNRQTKALASSVRDSVRAAGFPKPRTEGEDNGEWIIVDCGQAVVHIMQPVIRQYYHLEELWGETPVRLKFGAPKPAVAPPPAPVPAVGSKGKAKPGAKAKPADKAKPAGRASPRAAAPAKASARPAPTRAAAPVGRAAAPVTRAAKPVSTKAATSSAAATKAAVKDVPKSAPKKVVKIGYQAPTKPGAKTTSKSAGKAAGKPAVRALAKSAKPAKPKASVRKA